MVVPRCPADSGVEGDETDAWAVSLGRVRQENSDKRAVPWVGSYSTKICYTRSNPRSQAGTGTSLQDSQGCLGWVLRAQ